MHTRNKLAHCLLSLILVHLAICASGQTRVHLVQPEFSAYNARLHGVGGSISMFGFGQTDIFHAGMYHSTFTIAGDLVETNMIQGIEGEIAEEFVLRALPNGQTAVLATFSVCDVGGIPAQLGLLDALGQLVWMRHLDLQIPYNESLTDITYVQGELLFITDGIQSYYYDLDGDIVEPFEPPVIYDRQMLTASGMIASIDSVLYRLSPEFMVEDSLILSSEILQFDTTMSNGVFVQTVDSLHVLDSTLSHLRSALPPVPAPVRVMATSQAFWVVGDSNIIWQLDSALQIEAVHQINELVQITDVVHIGEVLFFAGDMMIGPWTRGLFCIRTDASDPNFSHQNDAALSDIVLLDTVRYASLTPHHILGFITNYGRIIVSIRNNSPEELNTLAIRFDESQCPFFCEGRFQLMWRLEDLQIQPGTTREVFLDSLVVGCQTAVPSELCLWISGPNEEPDRDHSNNAFCATIDLITAIKTPEVSESWTIYPNPATSDLHVRFHEEDVMDRSHLALIDAIGQPLLTKPVNELVEIIDVSHLPSGMYFIAVHHEEGYSLQKVVITGR